MRCSPPPPQSLHSGLSRAFTVKRGIDKKVLESVARVVHHRFQHFFCLSPFSLTITMGPRGVPVVNPDSAGLCPSAQNEESLPSGSHYSDHFPIDLYHPDVGI